MPRTKAYHRVLGRQGDLRRAPLVLQALRRQTSEEPFPPAHGHRRAQARDPAYLPNVLEPAPPGARRVLQGVRSSSPRSVLSSSTPAAARSWLASKFAQYRDGAPLVAAAAALLTSVAAFTKPADQAPTRAAYEQLAGDIRALAKQTEQAHDDIEELKSYLRGKGVWSEPSGTWSVLAPLVAVGIDAGLPLPPPPVVPTSYLHHAQPRGIPSATPKPKAVDPPSFDHLDVK